jgi:hypothetical protein
MPRKATPNAPCVLLHTQKTNRSTNCAVADVIWLTVALCSEYSLPDFEVFHISSKILLFAELNGRTLFQMKVTK